MGTGGAKKGAGPRLDGPTVTPRATPLVPTLDLELDDVVEQPLPTKLPAEMFTGPGLLALADLLPVMTAYYDSDLRLQFINKAFAEWLERPRGGLGQRDVDASLHHRRGDHEDHH